MSPRGRFIALIATALLISIAAPTAQALACSGAGARPTAANRAKVRSAVVCLVNAERRKRGLPALHSNRRLQSAARKHSQDMRKRHYFAHVTPAGKTDVQRARQAGYGRFRTLGENLAWGSGSLATPRAIVRSWMQSPGHRANILNRRFRDVGLGIALGAPVRGMRGGATYTAAFGSR